MTIPDLSDLPYRSFTLLGSSENVITGWVESLSIDLNHRPVAFALINEHERRMAIPWHAIQTITVHDTKPIPSVPIVSEVPTDSTITE